MSTNKSRTNCLKKSFKEQGLKYLFFTKKNKKASLFKLHFLEIQLSVLTPKNSRSLIIVSENNKNCVQYNAFKWNKSLLKCAFEIPNSICLND